MKVPAIPLITVDLYFMYGQEATSYTGVSRRIGVESLFCGAMPWKTILTIWKTM